MNFRKVFIRTLSVILPLGLTPLWAWLIMEDYLSFSGGEKDIVILIPWILWSLIYAVVGIVMWVKGSSLKRSVLWSCGFSTALLLLIWVVLLILSMNSINIRI